MAGQFIDFAAIREQVSLEQAMEYLGLKTKKQGETYRADCPACKTNDQRSLAITPSKPGFYCHKARKGGNDSTSLVAHIKGCSQREAAAELQAHYMADVKPTASAPTSTPSASTGELKPLDHLSAEHPAIEALGLTATACQALGIGYASKGVMRGRVAFPLRLPDGTLVGYFGLATTADMAPLVLLPKNLDERINTPPTVEEKPKPAADELRKLFRIVA
ncbi:MAG: CHC2 zinc finger domain-containing protein [Planctomycetota bacterium]